MMDPPPPEVSEHSPPPTQEETAPLLAFLNFLSTLKHVCEKKKLQKNNFKIRFSWKVPVTYQNCRRKSATVRRLIERVCTLKMFASVARNI